MSRDGARALLKRHELYAELLDVVKRELMDLGTPDETAELIAAFLVDYLRTYFAGQTISFPMDEHYELTLKELEARDMYTGDNLDKVARHIKMTPRGTRKLLARIEARIKEQRLAEAAPGQADIFGHADAPS